jgi:hypothetical protein
VQSARELNDKDCQLLAQRMERKGYERLTADRESRRASEPTRKEKREKKPKTRRKDSEGKGCGGTTRTELGFALRSVEGVGYAVEVGRGVLGKDLLENPQSGVA